MRRPELVPLVVLFVGVALALTGLWWMWSGFDIVQVERGWASVIAGACLTSGGVVTAALAAVLHRLDGLIGARTAVEGAVPAKPREAPAQPVADAPRLAAPEPLEDEPRTADAGRAPPEPHASAQPPKPPVVKAGPPPAAESPPAADLDEDGPDVVGRHVSGDTTYLMFADGRVEARTPDGVLRFSTIDELRAYADEREERAGR